MSDFFSFLYFAFNPLFRWLLIGQQVRSGRQEFLGGGLGARLQGGGEV